jgi:hypothetical protein
MNIPNMPTPHRLAVLRQYPTDIADGEVIALIDFVERQLAARARRSDPETSHEAAASVVNMTAKRQAVLDCLRAIGKGHDQAILDAYRSMSLPEQSDSGIRSRRAELVRMGHVVDRGVLLINGQQHTVWGLA